jgi:hypothetical protein
MWDDNWIYGAADILLQRSVIMSFHEIYIMEQHNLYRMCVIASCSNGNKTTDYIFDKYIQ